MQISKHYHVSLLQDFLELSKCKQASESVRRKGSTGGISLLLDDGALFVLRRKSGGMSVYGTHLRNVVLLALLGIYPYDV